ncbi:hypothetical protein L479_02835 [Exiguobacterium sp. S17]|nr:hypothetical protein L479_02835 [Exiguobacterium sp. S17]
MKLIFFFGPSNSKIASGAKYFRSFPATSISEALWVLSIANDGKKLNSP